MFDLMPFEPNYDRLNQLWNQLDRNLFFDFSQDRQCSTDILDKGDRYVLQAELPGFSKDDICVEVEGDLLTIRANCTENRKEDQEGCSYIRRERYCRSYQRSFDISGIQGDKISASYQNGVLELVLPKVSASQPNPKQIAIQ